MREIETMANAGTSEKMEPTPVTVAADPHYPYHWLVDDDNADIWLVPATHGGWAKRRQTGAIYGAILYSARRLPAESERLVIDLMLGRAS